MSDKLKLLSLSSCPPNYRLILWLFALVSVAFILLFVRFLSLAEQANLTTITEQEMISLVTHLDMVGILTLPDFWLVSLSWHEGDIAMFMGEYSALSLVIFCAGLLTYHMNIQMLTRCQVFMLLLCAGWGHFVLAKCILLFDIPTKLTGPVIAVGALSVLYFAIVAVGFDTFCSLRRGKA